MISTCLPHRSLNFGNARSSSLVLGRIFACMLTYLLLPCAEAQMFSVTNSTTAPIPGAGHDYVHLLNETVNPANGSVSVNINFPMPKGRGLTLPFSINYSSGQVIFSDPVHVWSQYINNEKSILVNIEAATWSNDSDLISSGGWVYGLPFANWSNGKMSSTGNYIDPNGNTQYCANTSGYVFRDMSGASHPLYLGAAGAEACQTASTQGGDDYFGASISPVLENGTGIVSASPPAVNTPLTVNDLVTGTIYRFTGVPSASAASYGETGGLLPYLIEDRNGNQINVTQSSGSTGTSLFSFSFADTLKRTVLSDTGFTGNPETLTAGGLNYTIQWRTTSANYSVPYSVNLATTMTMPGATLNCGGIYPIQLNPNNPNNGTDHLTVISSITLPNGQVYRFYYGDDNPHGLANPYGLLSEIDYPDGGSVQYTWKISDQYSDLMDYPAGNTANAPIGTTTNSSALIPDGCLYRYAAPVLATRTVLFAGTNPAETQTFSYATAWDSNNPGWDSKTTTVTTTDNVTAKAAVKQYAYLPIYEGIAPYTLTNRPSQIPVEKTVMTYDWGNAGTPIATETKAWYDQYQVACDFTTLSSGISSGHFYQYGPGVQVSDDKEYDFGQIASPSSVCTGEGTNSALPPIPTAPQSPTPVRETIRTYQAFSSSLGAVFSVPGSEVVYGSGTKMAETDYGYDTAAISTVSAVQHDEANYSAGVTANRANPTLVTRKCLAGCTTDSVTTATYDETGQMTSMRDGCGNAGCADMTGTNHTTIYSYVDSPAGGNAGGNSNAYLTQITDPLGHIQTSTYNYATGELASATDQNSNTTNYTYADPLNRLTQAQGPPNSNNGGQRPTTTYSYNDAAPSPSVTTTTVATPDPSLVSVSVRDGMGHVVQTQLSSDPAGADLVDTVYNGVGGVYSVSNPHRSGPSPTDGTTGFTYNALGQKVIQTNPDGSLDQWCYNGVASQGQTNCSANASSAANTSWIDSTDASERHWQRASDSFGRLLAVMEPHPGTGALALQTLYGYDALDDLLSVHQIGLSGETPRSRSFTYDPLGRLLCASNPETSVAQCPSASTGGYVSGTTGYSYDANGNVTAKTDARAQVVSYTYDALNRVTGKSFNGTQVTGYWYDGTFPPGIPGVALSGPNPNQIGRKSYMRANTPTAADMEDQYFGYDPMGRLKYWTEATPSEVGVSSNTVQAGYDLAGNMTGLTYPDGRHINQSYDAAGRLSMVGDGSAMQSYLQSAFYNADSSPSAVTLGNGVIQTVGKNNRLQVKSMTVTTPLPPFSQQPFLSHVYCYSTQDCPGAGSAGNNGNIWQIQDTLNAARTQAFSYDGLNRITSFALGGSVYQTYTTDSFGNMSPITGGNLLATFDPGTNRINSLPCSLVTLAFDAAGNQTCDTDQYNGVRSYAYDAESRVTNITTLGSGTPFEIYSYDAGGSRIRKDNADGAFTEYTNFGGQPIAEKDQTGTWTDYVYANGKKIAMVQPVKPAIHLHGVQTQGAYGVCGTPWYVNGQPGTALPYTVQPGDVLSFDHKAVSAKSGVWLAFGPGRYNNSSPSNNLTDYSPDGNWHHTSADLSGFANQVATALVVGPGDPTTPVGPYDAWIENLTIQSADGTVHPLFTGGAVTGSIWGTCGNTNLSLTVDPTPTDASTAATFYASDHLGSAQMEFSASGTPLSMSQFLPFGGEINPPVTANHYRFTGKERDTESGLDYFGARYYASSMGRWMSPDKVNVTEDRMMNPSSTLNKYAYAANNPLLYTDPDGEDITIFYEPANLLARSPGHTMLLAYDQSNGQSAIRSFGPDYANGASVLGALGSTPGTDSFGFQNIHSPDDLRAAYKSITIQTSPEEAEAVIAEIKAHPDGNYSILSKNCTTTCSKILRNLGKTKSTSITPGGFFSDLCAQYGCHPPPGPNGQDLDQRGMMFGNPRPGYNPFQLFFNDIPRGNPEGTPKRNTDPPCLRNRDTGGCA